MLRVLVTAFLFYALHRHRHVFSLSAHGRLLLCGLTGVAINQLFFFNGLKLSGPIQSALIMVTTPVWVYILSIIFLFTRFQWHKGVGVLFGLIGAILIIYQQDSSSFENAFLGNILVFINALSYAFYLVIVKPLMSKYPPTLVLRWVFLYGLILVFPFSIKPALATPFDQFNPSLILPILYVVLITTYVAYRLNGFALSKANPILVSIYLYLQPLVAAIISIVLGIEYLTWKKLLAAILILCGIVLVSMQNVQLKRHRR